MLGIIARIVEARGYGFISPVSDELSKQIFFHSSDLVGGLTFDSGQLFQRRVEFDFAVTAKGPRALRVRPAP